jgi:hypothetical protein
MFCKVPSEEEEDPAPEIDMSPNCATTDKNDEVVPRQDVTAEKERAWQQSLGSMTN